MHPTEEILENDLVRFLFIFLFVFFWSPKIWIHKNYSDCATRKMSPFLVAAIGPGMARMARNWMKTGDLVPFVSGNFLESIVIVREKMVARPDWCIWFSNALTYAVIFLLWKDQDLSAFGQTSGRTSAPESWRSMEMLHVHKVIHTDGGLSAIMLFLSK